MSIGNIRTGLTLAEARWEYCDYLLADLVSKERFTELSLQVPIGSKIRTVEQQIDILSPSLATDIGEENFKAMSDGSIDAPQPGRVYKFYLADNFLHKLLKEKLSAFAFPNPRNDPSAKRSLIPADVWESPQIDWKENTVSGNGLSYLSIQVFEMDNGVCQRRGKNTPFAGAIIHHCGGVKVHQLLQSNTRCYGLSR